MLNFSKFRNISPKIHDGVHRVPFLAIFIENFKAQYNHLMDTYRPKIKSPFNVYWHLIKMEKCECNKLTCPPLKGAPIMATSFLKRTIFTTCFTREFKTRERWNILIDIIRSEFRLRAI